MTLLEMEVFYLCMIATGGFLLKWYQLKYKL